MFDATGIVDCNVIQRTVDYPDEIAAVYHLVLDNGEWVTVRGTRWKATRMSNLERRGLSEPKYHY